MQSYTQQIIRVLEKVTSSGAGQSQIFDDFLTIVHSSLRHLPNHVASSRHTGQLAEDIPEVAGHWIILQSRYKNRSYFDLFAKAFAILLESAHDEWNDTIGEVYMEFGHPSKWGGQFFTPFHLAKMMAMMTTADIPNLVHERIKAACQNDPLAQAILVAGAMLEGKDTQKWYFEKLIPTVARNVKHVSINDASCGSGVMFLAAASEMPRWMLDWGFIRFYGQDIDQTCVLMAQINMMLHGLNGYSMKCAVAMTELELSANPERPIEITDEVHALKQVEIVNFEKRI